MDGLRWLLLLFGVLVVAGVYFYSRYQREQAERPAEEPEDPIRVEPSLSADLPDEDLPVLDADDEVELPAASEPAKDEEQKIVTIRVVARNKGTMNGGDLALSLRGIGMRHGRFGIFHRYEGSNEDHVVFSAASLVEPGAFDLTNIKEQELPGISLFMVLPGPIDGVQAFDLMMVAARALAQSLNAELFDETGSTLSIQRERYLREEIIQFQHGILVA